VSDSEAGGVVGDDEILLTQGNNKRVARYTEPWYARRSGEPAIRLCAGEETGTEPLC
jgi:hypothetical protein